MFKILCTGNPNYIGIPYSLSKVFKNIDFAHKSNGFDLTNSEQFRILINKYNVFINHSAFNYTIQKDLLQLTVEQWQKNKKIYLEIDGFDFWNKAQCDVKQYDNVLPNWQDQMLNILKKYKVRT